MNFKRFYSYVLTWVVGAAVTGCGIVPGLDMSLDRSIAGAPSQIGGYELKRVSARSIGEYADELFSVEEGEGHRVLTGYSELVNKSEVGPYRIGSGDVLSIVVWDHPELTNPTGDFRDPESAGRLVDVSGRIFYPYIGEIDVAGMTVSQVRRYISARLAKVVREPQVDVRVAAFRSQKVKVTGAVRTPGLLNLDDTPITITEAIAGSGGLSEDAVSDHVILLRHGIEYSLPAKDGVVGFNAEDEIILRNRDVVHIPNTRDRKLYVMGAVRGDQAIRLEKANITLADALGRAGGVDSDAADFRRIYLIRNKNVPGDEYKDAVTVYEFDFKGVSSLFMAERVRVRANDILYVDRTGLASFSKVVSQVLPAVSTVFQLDRLLDQD